MAYRINRGGRRVYSAKRIGDTNNKYHTQKVEVDGIKFDSAREAQRYFELVMLQDAGDISDLIRQVTIELQPKFTDYSGKNQRAINYIADFVYRDRFGSLVLEDSKGFKTKDFLLKQKLLLFKYPEYKFILT